jgi:hypothetical protein
MKRRGFFGAIGAAVAAVTGRAEAVSPLGPITFRVREVEPEVETLIVPVNRTVTSRGGTEISVKSTDAPHVVRLSVHAAEPSAPHDREICYTSYRPQGSRLL